LPLSAALADQSNENTALNRETSVTVTEKRWSADGR
jgi:hypothetical protein